MNSVNDLTVGQAVLDVYIAKAADLHAAAEDIIDLLRRAEVLSTKHEELRRDRAAVWCLLQHALSASLGIDPETVRFRKQENGKWICGAAHFSLTHSAGCVGVAVSTAPVGLDIEEKQSFAAKFSDADRSAKLLERVRTPREKASARGGAEELLRLWVAKESIYKASGLDHFSPNKTDTASRPVRCISPASVPVFAAVCGDHLSALRVFVLSGGEWHDCTDEVKDPSPLI